MSASNMKTIKNRIKSIQSTMQITKAMELVASSKIRKLSERTERSKPYFNILKETLDDIAMDNKDFSSVFTREREGKVCHIVIAGDRGLAGGYNHNLFKSLEISDEDIIFPIGRKTVEYFGNRNFFSTDYEKTADVEISDCRDMGISLAKAYEKGEFTQLYISYTSFVNMIVQEPKTVKLLPLKLDSDKTNTSKNLTIYEPGAETAFSHIVPYYLSGMIYGAVTESVMSETASRRNAMQSASENATEMIENLRFEYNRARQATITQELTEIIAGTEKM